MDRFTLDFSLPNFVLVGLIGAFWFLLIFTAGRLVLGNAAPPARPQSQVSA